MKAWLLDFGFRIPDCGFHHEPLYVGCYSGTGNPASCLLASIALLLSFASLGFAAESDSTASTNSSLPAALAELAKLDKEILFKDVIFATTQHRVLDFDTNNSAHVELRKKILAAAALAGERARREGLPAERANEAGNHMESFVKDAMREIGLTARTPVTTAGSAQSAGYPDIEITGPVPAYLDLKTFSAGTADSTQRAFYYSPSTRPKVTRDALHLLLAFEMERTESGGKAVFVPVRWKLLTLQNLRVELKFEFNQSNRGLYGSDAGKAVLDEGGVK